MPYLPTSQEFLEQSSLLFQAYPDARVTTKYTYPKNRRSRAPQSQRNDGDVNMSSSDHKPASEAPPSSTSNAAAAEEAATLTLKTYHPESGLCLKYRTDKAAEIGRLIAGLGLLAAGRPVGSLDTTTSRPANGADGAEGGLAEEEQPAGSSGSGSVAEASGPSAEVPSDRTNGGTSSRGKGGKAKRKGR